MEIKASNDLGKSLADNSRFKKSATLLLPKVEHFVRACVRGLDPP